MIFDYEMNFFGCFVHVNIRVHFFFNVLAQKTNVATRPMLGQERTAFEHDGVSRLFDYYQVNDFFSTGLTRFFHMLINRIFLFINTNRICGDSMKFSNFLVYYNYCSYRNVHIIDTISDLFKEIHIQVIKQCRGW